MDIYRYTVIQKAARHPEFECFPVGLRENIAEVCLKRFTQRRDVRMVENSFGVLICSAVAIGLIVGHLQWGFWGALAVMASMVLSVCATYALVFRFAWKRWLHIFIKSSDFKQLQNTYFK